MIIFGKKKKDTSRPVLEDINKVTSIGIVPNPELERYKETVIKSIQKCDYELQSKVHTKEEASVIAIRLNQLRKYLRKIEAAQVSTDKNKSLALLYQLHTYKNMYMNAIKKA